MPHGHFASAGLSNSGAGYGVLGRLLDDVPRTGLQAPLEATGLVAARACAPITPLTDLTSLSTLHGVLQWGEPFGTLVKAAAFVQVKAWLAFRAEVFAETGLAVFYPAPGAHVDLWCAHAIESRRTGVKTLSILTHPLSSQEEEEFGLTVHAPIVLGAHRTPFTNGVHSITSCPFVPSPAMRLRLTVAILHAVQHDKGKGEESKLHLDGCFSPDLN